MLAALAAAAGFAATASGAGVAQDPLRLTLQRSDSLVTGGTATTVSAAVAPTSLVPRGGDFPSGTRTSASPMQASALAPLGRGLKGASWSAVVPAGGSLETPIGVVPKSWSLEGEVLVAPDRAAAQRLFQLGKAAGIGFAADDMGDPIRLTLPALGDEQLAFWTRRTAGREMAASVFVRKGAVVWQVSIAGVPLQWRASRTQLVEQLKTYAARQKARVAAG